MTRIASSLSSRQLARTGGWLSLIGLAGVGLGASGLVMIFTLPVTGLGWYGALLIGIGMAQFGELVRHLDMTGRALRALLAVVYVGAGLAIIAAPSAISELEILVAILFVAAGAFRIAWALAWPSWSKLWGLAAGLGALLLGLLMLIGWPNEALWLLGAAAAIDLTLYGVAALALGETLKPQRSGRRARSSSGLSSRPST